MQKYTHNLEQQTEKEYANILAELEREQELDHKIREQDKKNEYKGNVVEALRLKKAAEKEFVDQQLHREFVLNTSSAPILVNGAKNKSFDSKFLQRVH